MSWDHRAFGHCLAGAAEVDDREAVGGLVDDLVGHIASSKAPYPADPAARILAVLRRRRYFNELGRVAEALLAAGPAEPVVRRQFGQALIEEGRTNVAIDVLSTAVEETSDAPEENREARGLLARAYKQRYIDAVSTQDQDLTTAARLYLEVYQEDPTDPERLWHGINSVALLSRAARDGVVAPSGAPDPAVIAESILDQIELRRDDVTASMWDFATALEACVALGRGDEALAWARRYAQHSNADAFEFGSTVRQLVEVWQLRLDEEPGMRLLPLLQAALLRREAGRLDLEAGSDLQETIQALTSSGGYEAVLGSELFQNVVWLEKAVLLGGSVARVRDANDEPKGTAFVVRGSDFASVADAPDELLLLTNAHVISANPNDEPALLPEEARISFERDDDGSVYHAAVVWSSPREMLDATLIRTDPPLANRTPVPTAARLPRLNTRVYIIGHPGYQPLSYSIYDNRLLAADDTHLHYRTPTQGGSSGSPVFNPQWELIGLHHKGNVPIGDPATSTQQPANEGLIFSAIIDAAAAQVDGEPV